MGSAALVVRGFDDRIDRLIRGVVFCQPIDQVDELVGFQEDQASSIEVIGEGAEGLRAKPDLCAAFPR